MVTPTPDELRAQSEVLTARFPDDDGGTEDQKLAARAVTAAAIVASLTFRLIDPITESTVDGYAFEEVPDGLKPVAARAIALMTARAVLTGELKLAVATATGRRLRSFTAGPYSESYFAPGELGVKEGRPRLDPDDEIDAALWALATRSARSYLIFLSTGVAEPAAGVQSFDYRRARGGYLGGRYRRY